MSESQGTSTSTERPAKTAALSGHWKIAVLAAAGFATIVGATTVVAVSDDGAAEAKPASAAKDGGKARTNPQTVSATRDGMDADGGDGDYWAGHAGNPGESSGGKEKDDHSDSGGKEGNGGKEKDSEDHDEEKDSGGRDGHDDDHRRGSHDGDDDKTTFVECDPDDLISAIVQANELEGPSRLKLAEKCTYTLTATQDGNGLPKITQPITILGNGATIARAANAAEFRIFEVGAGGDLKLRHLTLTRGKADGDDGGGINVNAAGRLDLDHVTLENNTLSDFGNFDGGAIYNEGITAIHNSTLNKNSARDGGAINNFRGRLDISTSEFTNNIANDDGSAVANDGGTTKIAKSLISHNHALFGGALFNSGGLSEVEQSAITHNFGGSQGGIRHVGGALYVRKSTISNNTTTGQGGGLVLNASTVIEDSKITDNTAATSIGGGISVSLSANEEVAIRDTKITGNRAPGNGSSGGGIFIFSGSTTVTLTDSKVKDNTSDEPAGGIENRGTVVTKGRVKIIDNVPTNCDSPTSNPVPSCFG
ncbi:right-handed parallel beta-helix repeat-containing protein [Streptomyces sp. NPDC001514]